MVKDRTKKAQFQKMVLVPFTAEQKAGAEENDEIDFSKHTDTPFMAHIKLEMKKTLRNPRLSMRDKSRLHNQLLHKYLIAKENHLKEKNLQKTLNTAATSQPREVAVHPEVNNQDDGLWWDDSGMNVDAGEEEATPPTAEATSSVYDQWRSHWRSQPARQQSREDIFYEAREHSPPHSRENIFYGPREQEFSDDEMLFDNYATRFNETLFRHEGRKRTRFENSDHDEENRPGTITKRRNAVDSPPRRFRVGKRRLKTSDPDGDQDDEDRPVTSRKHMKLPPLRQRQNAIDSPPLTKQSRLRKSIQRGEIFHKRTEPSELFAVVDDRFKKQTRKREGSKHFSGKRRWLGGHVAYDAPPRGKQKRYTATNSDDDDNNSEASDVKWSKLPK